MDVLSHRLRTITGQPGNSRANLIALYMMGVAWVEADVSYSEDGLRIIIHHPGKSKPNVDVMDIVTFLGIISSLPKMHCCLDIKINSEQLTSKLVYLITQLRLEERVYLTAFQRKIRIPFMVNLETNGWLLQLAKQINPKIKTHIIATWPWTLSKIAKKYKTDAISFGWLPEPPMVRFISKALFKLSACLRNLPGQISELQSQNIKVWAGICNDPKDMLYLAGLGVDGIMTDEPKTLIALIEKQKIS